MWEKYCFWLTVTVHSTTQCYITNVRHVFAVMSTFPDDYIANVRHVFAVMSTFPDDYIANVRHVFAVMSTFPDESHFA
jgi:hypothetical protein